MSSVTPSNNFVVDTIALILYLEKRQMGDSVKVAFAKMERQEATIYIPGMVVSELLYLSERGRIQATVANVVDLLARFQSCQECPLSIAVIKAAAEINDIPELHDRLIAGTARLLNAPLLTNDSIIQKSHFLQTIWA